MLNELRPARGIPPCNGRRSRDRTPRPSQSESASSANSEVDERAISASSIERHRACRLSPLERWPDPKDSPLEERNLEERPSAPIHDRTWPHHETIRVL